MRVEYHFFGPMRDAVGEKVVARDHPPGTTVGDGLRELADRYDDLGPHLFADDGGFADRVVVTLNGRNVAQLDGPETEIGDGDVVRASPPVHGGAPG